MGYGWRSFDFRLDPTFSGPRSASSSAISEVLGPEFTVVQSSSLDKAGFWHLVKGRMDELALCPRCSTNVDTLQRTKRSCRDFVCRLCPASVSKHQFSLILFSWFYQWFAELVVFQQHFQNTRRGGILSPPHVGTHAVLHALSGEFAGLVPDSLHMSSLLFSSGWGEAWRCEKIP